MTAVLSSGCGRVAEKVALSDVCQKEQNAVVNVEGFLRLPIVNNDDPSAPVYTLLLVERLNGTGNFLTTQVPATDKNEPNRIGTLPASYTYKDFHVVTNNGKTASSNDRVNVTGEVSKRDSGCVLKISKIETQ